MALLTCSDVTFSYEGIPVLTDVNFALEAGSYLCIAVSYTHLRAHET